LFATKLNAVRAFKVYYKLVLMIPFFTDLPITLAPKAFTLAPKAAGSNGVRWRGEVKRIREG
jgi:hypothetical protein